MTPDQTTDIMRTIAACWPDTSEADAQIIRLWCQSKDHELMRRTIGTVKLRSLWNTVKPAELVNAYAVAAADASVDRQAEQRTTETEQARRISGQVHRESVMYLERQDPDRRRQAREIVMARFGSAIPDLGDNESDDPRQWSRLLVIWTHLQLERNVLPWDSRSRSHGLQASTATGGP